MRPVPVVALLLVLAGCGEDEIVTVGAPAPGQTPQGGGDAATGAPMDGEGVHVELADDDFVETDVRNRDPFRSFTDHFRPEAPTDVQRRVTMPEVSVDQMHLVAIIGRLPQPRAMLVDPNGVGHVVKRGDYVGRAEVVQAGGPEGMPVTLNWRVDRIRTNELVLSREDPTAPDQPPLRRVLALYDDEELVSVRTFH
jgi:type IV pilus assembly protein PilP